MGEQRIVLEQQPDIALIGALAGHGFAGDLDDAAVRLLEAGNEAQRRRLAAAAGARAARPSRPAPTAKLTPIDRRGRTERAC